MKGIVRMKVREMPGPREEVQIGARERKAPGAMDAIRRANSSTRHNRHSAKGP